MPAQLAWRLGRFDRGLKLLGEIQARVGPLAGRQLLDLGAAHGGDACAAVALGMRATVADFRDHQYETLAEHMSVLTNIGSVLFDFNDEWPLPDGAFDAVLALGVLEHVPDLQRFFRQIARVLRAGGFAVVQTAFALPSIHRDALYGLPLVGVLPMRLRRLVAEGVFKRRYSCKTANRTFYMANRIRRAAEAAGLAAHPHKYADSPLMARVARWPAAGMWRYAARQLCADYVLVTSRGSP